MPEDLRKSCQRLALIGVAGLEEIITARGKNEDGTPGAYLSKDGDRIAATKLAMEYGFGKPVQPLSGADGEGPIEVVIQRLFTEPGGGR